MPHDPLTPETEPLSTVISSLKKVIGKRIDQQASDLIILCSDNYPATGGGTEINLTVTDLRLTTDPRQPLNRCWAMFGISTRFNVKQPGLSGTGTI